MAKYTTEQRIASFWNNVAITADDTKCWLWLGGVGARGYGMKWWIDRNTRAHRVAWMIPDYFIPSNMEVCHTCDNPLCVNPKHLFLGTHAENMKDRDSKGRGIMPPRIGEHNGMSKLTNENINEIRERYALGGVTQQELATEYGVARSNISLIFHYRTWKKAA